MGIRFLCQHCDRKLNVKSFLAGKRGVCPHCDGKIIIPAESQLPARKEAEADAEVAKSVPAEAPAPEPAAAASGTCEPVANDPSVATAVEPDIPTGTAVQSPAAEVAPDDIPVGQAVAAPDPTPAASEPLPAAAPNPPAQASPIVSDPLTESPHMVWYVRPPSGGQFGPARGDIMRKWIDEGRVSADSLVWREGWAEWQTAAEVLPTLATGPAVPAAPLGAPSTNGHSASGNASFSANQYRSRRRKSNQLAVISVIMLVLVSIALLVTLIVKMQSGV